MCICKVYKAKLMYKMYMIYVIQYLYAWLHIVWILKLSNALFFQHRYQSYWLPFDKNRFLTVMKVHDIMEFIVLINNLIYWKKNMILSTYLKPLKPDILPTPKSNAWTSMISTKTLAQKFVYPLITYTYEIPTRYVEKPRS